MDSVTPGTVDLTMTLATQLLWLIKINQVAGIVDKLVTRLRIMTVQAPDAAVTMLQVQGIRHEIHMHGQLTRRRIGLNGRRK